MQHTESQNLLVDFEDTYTRASHGKRFANYIIDIIAFYILISLVAVFWVMVSPETFEDIMGNELNLFVDQLISLTLYASFMFAQESIFKGRSIGKFITGTRAVAQEGTPITQRQAMLRALSRAVPFSAFSALGSPCNPWQDKWTDTMVIDIRRSTNLNQL